MIIVLSSHSTLGTRIKKPKKPPLPDVFGTRQTPSQRSNTGTEEPHNVPNLHDPQHLSLKSCQTKINELQNQLTALKAQHDKLKQENRQLQLRCGSRGGSPETDDEDVHFLEIPMPEQNGDLLTSAEDSPQNAAATCPLPVSAESPSSEDESHEQSRVLVPHVSTTPPSLSLRVKITEMTIPRIPKHKAGGVVVGDHKHHIFSLLDFFLELSLEVDHAGKLPIRWLFYHVQRAIISKFLDGEWAKHLNQQNRQAFAWHLKNQEPDEQFCLSFSKEQPGVPFNPKPLQNLGISVDQSDLIRALIESASHFPGICAEFTVSIQK